MKITFITLFPEIFPPLLNFSILKRAQAKNLIEFEVLNLREFGEGAHLVVDDRPYGGGAGMVLKAEVLKKALLTVKTSDSKVFLTSAAGETLTQKKSRQLSKEKHLIIICGHYEGVDQRFVDKYVDEEFSIGDYVLTGGELPSLVLADSIARLLPGVLEKAEATLNESYENGLLEHPHFTRPEEFEGLKVPEVLLSGNHKEIEDWRQKESLSKTHQKRPDLITKRI
jgi:tRNA (guanine37-N1)-methyltransferase